MGDTDQIYRAGHRAFYADDCRFIDSHEQPADRCGTREIFDRIVTRFAEKTEVLSAVGTKEGLGEEAELFIVKSC